MNWRDLAATLVVTLGFLDPGFAYAQIYVNEPTRTITPVFEKLSTIINTKGPIYVNVRPCGVKNAYWDNQSEIVVCSELYDPIIGRLSSNRTPEMDAYNTNMLGQLTFVVLHELGHALIDRHRIPFSGREEDTADQFAAYVIMKMNNFQAYLGATNFFAERDHLLHIFGKRQLTDEHGLNIQRRAQLVCWGYGRNAQSVQVMAQRIGLTPARLQRCPEEYAQLMQNTPRLFAASWKQQQQPKTPAW